MKRTEGTAMAKDEIRKHGDVTEYRLDRDDVDPGLTR
jgi:hypothetical protein